MILVAVVMMVFVFIIWHMSELQRQINEVEDLVRMLHADFAEVVYKQYGEKSNGEE